jgi:uncharacterized membrane protein YfcA
MLDPIVLVALGGAGLLAGFVDAIAGGGALIAIPALLTAGLPPVSALATTKVQSFVGTSIAAITYWRNGFVSLPDIAIAIAAAFAASFAGAMTIKQIDVSLLQMAVPVALILVGLYFLLAPKLSDEDRRARLSFAIFVPMMAAVVGYYDGLLGPGTGSFLTAGFIALFGLGVTRATGNTKVLNLASNAGALVLFVLAGDVVWPAAAAMAIGQVAGGYLGALTGIRFGARIIRPLVVVISTTLAIKLLFFR